MTDPQPETDRPAILRLDGDVDFFTEDGFRAEAERLLAAPHIDRLVVDLSDVGVMDSSGLSLLVDLLRLCRDMDLSMTLRSVPARMIALLDVTGLDQVICVESVLP